MDNFNYSGVQPHTITIHGKTHDDAERPLVAQLAITFDPADDSLCTTQVIDSNHGRIIVTPKGVDGVLMITAAGKDENGHTVTTQCTVTFVNDPNPTDHFSFTSD